jgi:hypothetical protein
MMGMPSLIAEPGSGGVSCRRVPIGFDEFSVPSRSSRSTSPDLTSPMLNRFIRSRLPRPVIPLDEGVEWRLAAGGVDRGWLPRPGRNAYRHG